MPQRSLERRAAELRDILDRAAHQYYNDGSPELSDADYDALYAELVALETEHPELVVADSPTQRVGAPLPRGSAFAKVPHLVPMLSIESLTDVADVREFDERVRRLLDKDQPVHWAIEPKLDGVSANLLYENGVFVRGLSRGDGAVGEDITQNLRTLRSIPLRLHEAAGRPPAQLEVRGEVILGRKAFAELQATMQTSGDTPFRNPRNTVAGTLKLLDARAVAKRPLDFIAFGTGHREGLDAATHTATRDYLAACGFTVASPYVVADSIDAVIDYHDDLERRRESFDYEMDGIVAKVDDIALQRRLGRTARAPRWALAFKFAPRRAITRVENIVAQVGRTGAITPSAELTPVEVAGVTVRRATLHNWGLLVQRDVRVGDYVTIERAGDVIPAVVEVDLARRPADSQPTRAPERCPTCDTPLEAEGAFLYCVNLDCRDQLHGRVLHFVSRRALDIRRLGDKHIDQLIDVGLIRHLEDVFTLPAKGDAILALDRWAQKSFDNLCEQIEIAKRPTLARFLHALGIRHVGEQTAKDLADEFQSLDALRNATEAELLEVDGVGPEVSSSVLHFFALEQTAAFLQAIANVGVEVQSGSRRQRSASGDDAAGDLDGMTFCFTGGLSKLSRDDARALVEARGARTSASVTKKVTHVVAGEGAGSKLAKAEQLGLLVLSEDEFLTLVGRA